VAVTIFAKHWQELAADKQKIAFKTEQAVGAVSSQLEQWSCNNPVWTREKLI
jgi:hypothetical protein